MGNWRFLSLLCGVLCASSTASAADASWREKAQRDLAAIRVAIEDSHPGTIDVENPNFRAWLYDGYFKAMQMLPKVNNAGGYGAVLRFYVNGFHDVHLALSLSGMDKASTPGFLTRLEKGEYVVANRMNFESHAPPIGAKLLACDGKSAMMLAHDNLDPYFTVTQLNAHRWLAAPYLFVDTGNPFVKRPERCTFQIGEEQREFVLEWRECSSGSLDNGINGILDWNPNLGLRQLGNRGFWLTLPTMTAATDYPPFLDLLATLRTRAAEIRAADLLVIDVRSNSGGAHEWGTAIANAIWGADYVRRRAPEATLDMRASATTVSFASTDAARKEIKGRAALEGTNRDIVEALSNAYAAKRPWVSIPVFPTATPRARLSESPVKGKVVLLTDTWCVSACLMFADLVFELADTVHVGQPTNADTLYTGVRPQRLESKNATLSMPVEVFRRRKRAANQSYVPRHVWRGNIADTYEIERWILQLTDSSDASKLASSEAAPATSSPVRTPSSVQRRSRKR